jgi:hypothetical protein
MVTLAITSDHPLDHRMLSVVLKVQVQKFNRDMGEIGMTTRAEVSAIGPSQEDKPSRSK